MIAPRRRNPGRGGFTLVELLAVMIIIGIVLGVAVPGPLAERSRRTQREEIERLRRGAIRDRRAHTDTIDFNGRTVRATAWPGGFVMIDSLDASSTPIGRKVPDAK